MCFKTLDSEENCLTLNSSLLHVCHELAEHVTPRIVGAHHDDLTAARLADSYPELFGTFPHHLGELTALDHSTWFQVECVLLDFLVPGPADVFGIGFGVPIGRPQAVQIFTILRVLPVGKPVVPGKYFGPLLRIPDQFLM